MQPVLLAAPQDLPSDQLDDWGLVKEAMSEPPATVRGRSHLTLPNGMSVGTWECTPGRWRRQIMRAEFAHFIAGHAWFHPDHGRPFEIRAGDAVYFAPNTTGTWDITETVRKTYVVIDMPNLQEHVLRAVPTPLRGTLRTTRAMAAAALSALRGLPQRLLPARAGAAPEFGR